MRIKVYEINTIIKRSNVLLKYKNITEISC